MKKLLLISTILLLSIQLTWAQEALKDTTLSGYDKPLDIGNPINKTTEMALQDRKADYYRFDPKVTQHWFDWKRKLKENTGIQISVNYTSMFIGATSVITEENPTTASSGIFDATIIWNFLNRKKGKNQGSIIFWVDQRHLYYGDSAPHFFNFEAGSALLPALKFNKWTFRALEFYYQQKLFNGRAGFIIGKIDMADWFTYNGLLHPMMHFSDFGFSVNPTVSWSNPGFGIVAAGWLDKKKRFGIQLGLNDVAGDNLNSSNFLDMGVSSWEHGRFLKMVELMYSPIDAPYYRRISATFWHSDELLTSENSWFQTASSTGFTVQGTWLIKNKYAPVFTFGLSDGNGGNGLSKLNVSLMHAWYFKSHDLVGIGLNYTESTISGVGQYLSEIFYRFTLSKAVSITPSVKMVLNPALDTSRDFLGYYGIRSRIMF